MATDDISWLSTAEAAKRLGVTSRTLYRFIDEDQLRGLPVRQGHPAQAERRRPVHRDLPDRAGVARAPLSRTGAAARRGLNRRLQPFVQARGNPAQGALRGEDGGDDPAPPGVGSTRMGVAMNVAEIRSTKGDRVATIPPDRPVVEAIELLRSNGIGALVAPS